MTGAEGRRELKTVQELDLTGGSDTQDAPPGQYTLELIGTWDRGTAPIYFGIRIAPAGH